MNLPTRYSYNPKSSHIVLIFSAGILWIATLTLLCRCKPGSLSVLFGLAPILLGFLLTVRRFGFKRDLVLEHDALLLPSGFGRGRVTRIPYADIQRVWETRLPWTAVLCVGTKQGKFEIPSTMLPDAGSYVAVGEFLVSRAKDNLKS
jgi:hypothetical protein